MKRIVAVVFLIAGLAVLQACDNDDCGNGPVLRYFDVKGFSVSNVLRPDLSWTFNQYFEAADTINPVNAEIFGIELQASLLFYANARAGTSANGVAFACSPPMPGESGSQETIADIRITSDADFDAAHPAGAVLNQFFRISAVSFRYYPPHDSLRNEAILLADFLSSEPKARDCLQLWLTQRPEASLEHRFTVSYHQTNGEHYLIRAPKVTFH